MPVIWSALSLAVLVCLGGCSKSGDAGKEPPMDVQGVKVDIPQMMAEFVNASPELYKQASEVTTDVRYNQYREALVQLDEMSKNPKLTPKQKQLLTKVMEQMKQVVEKGVSQPNEKR